MTGCQTRPLTPDRSTCLSELPDCPFKVTLGFNCICTHPDHEKFNVKGMDQQARKSISRFV